MKRIALAAALSFACSLAIAGNCPNEAAAIDAALPKTKVDGKKVAEAKKLRDDGMRLHKEGKHAESMAALGKAKGILGIK